MPRVPQHSVVWRLPHQSSLAVRVQAAEQINDSSIVIQMLSAAVCGTDLALLSGARPGRAQVLGHEGIGVVLYAPRNSTVSNGERVIINPVHRKRPEMVIGHSCDGIFRGMFCVDAADVAEGGLLVPCPANCFVQDTELALAEPLASVIYSLELLREQCGEASLLIRGSGTVGILAAKLWTTLTGSHAILVSKSEAHARWLRESTSWPANVRLCCTAQLNSTIRECSNWPPLTAAILCCSRESAPEGLRSLMDVLPEHATIDMMAGFPAEYVEDRFGNLNLDVVRWNNVCGMNGSPPTAVVDRATGKNLSLIGHRGTAARHILEAVDLLSRRVIVMTDIPHRLLTLDELPGAVKQMLTVETRHRAKWVKAIVTFSPKDFGETNGAC